MSQEPSMDAVAFSPRPQPWPPDPSNVSALPAEANLSSNTTWTEFNPQFFSDYRNIVFLVALLISLCGLVGNGTVIWLLSFSMMRTPFLVYILNLAIADFLYLSHQSIVFIMFFSNYNTRKPEVLSPLLLFTSYLAGRSLLMAISTERCLSGIFPIWYRCRCPAHLSAIVCALIWGLSICLGLFRFLCDNTVPLSCSTLDLAFCVMTFLLLLVLCVSSLTLLVHVQCSSLRRQPTKLYRVILLTVLAFLVFGLSLSLGVLVNLLLPSWHFYDNIHPILLLLSIQNSVVNPSSTSSSGGRGTTRAEGPSDRCSTVR